MRIVLALIIGLFAGSALATEYNSVDTVKSLISQYRALKAMQALTGPEVLGVECEGEAINGRHVIRVRPSDTGWNSLLSSLNTVINAQATAVKAQLEALGVTGVPN